ncbi:MAG: biotin/lipoyl-binding protein [Saprospiraceae bacterium]|nr:biotin/lipoyl-binding protein [Saprospiraceae bacterium]
MSKRKVLVEGQEIEIDDSILKDLDVQKQGLDGFHLIFQNHSMNARLVSISLEDRIVHLKVGNKSYLCKIGRPMDDVIAQLNFNKSNGRAEKNILAPMAGLILEIHVREGQEIFKGDKLITLEAMKMENVIRAPKDGQLDSIYIEKAAKVDKGQRLLSFK